MLFVEPTLATVSEYEAQRGWAAVAVGVGIVVAEQIAGAGPEEGEWESRHGVGAGVFGWRFAVVDFGVDAVAVIAADPIRGERAVSMRESRKKPDKGKLHTVT